MICYRSVYALLVGLYLMQGMHGSEKELKHGGLHQKSVHLPSNVMSDFADLSKNIQLWYDHECWLERAITSDIRNVRSACSATSSNQDPSKKLCDEGSLKGAVCLADYYEYVRAQIAESESKNDGATQSMFHFYRWRKSRDELRLALGQHKYFVHSKKFIHVHRILTQRLEEQQVKLAHGLVAAYQNVDGSRYQFKLPIKLVHTLPMLQMAECADVEMAGYGASGIIMAPFWADAQRLTTLLWQNKHAVHMLAFCLQHEVAHFKKSHFTLLYTRLGNDLLDKTIICHAQRLRELEADAGAIFGSDVLRCGAIVWCMAMRMHEHLRAVYGLCKMLHWQDKRDLKKAAVASAEIARKQAKGTIMDSHPTNAVRLLRCARGVSAVEYLRLARSAYDVVASANSRSLLRMKCEYPMIYAYAFAEIMRIINTLIVTGDVSKQKGVVTS